MTWLLIVLAFFLVFICYIFLAPFYFEVDSDNNLFRFRFHRLASAQLLIKESSLFVKINLVGWKKMIDVLESKPVKVKKKRHKLKIQRRSKLTIKQLRSVLKSFKINNSYVDISFNDQRLNAFLFPVFFFLNKTRHVKIFLNFVGRNRVKLEVENNLARILKAYYWS